MSVLVFHNALLASKAAATLVAAEMIEKPAAVLGFEFHKELFQVYRNLADLSKEGILDWSEIHSYLLTERVDSEPADSIASEMNEKVFRYTNIRRECRFTPPSSADDWSLACNGYEDDILDDGGIDLLLVHIESDGSLACNYSASELAPITHVERALFGKVVTAGITTILSARKIVAVMIGEDKAELARKVFSGSITPMVPASYLQLHANTVFLLDDPAAKYL